MPVAITSPMTAPSRVLVAPPSARAAACVCPSRKSAVSIPSRITAVKARAVRPHKVPSVRTRSTDACSSFRTPAAWRRIQNSIQVTTAAATTIAMPSKICSAGSENSPMVAKSTMPTTRLTPAGRRDTQPDLAEVAAVPGARQIGEHDAHDEGRLDPFAEAGQQPGGQKSEIQRQMLLAIGGEVMGRTLG